MPDFETEVVQQGGKFVELRVNLKTEDDAQSWLKDYQEKNNVHFIWKDGMSSKPTRYVYHKKWTCQLSEQNKTASSKRDMKCGATVDIKIKLLTKDTRKKDPFLRRAIPLQGIIKLNENHSHETACNEALGKLRIAPEIRGTFLEYFSTGCGPMEAIRMHESKLMLSDDGVVQMANARVNPSQRTVYYIYRDWRESEYGKDWTSNNALNVLREKIPTYEKNETQINISELGADWAICIVTPIMRRAQQLREAGEIIFTDSTGSCDSELTNVTVILTATKAGAVPIAVLLHSSKSEEGYHQAYYVLKDKYPLCFGGKSCPEVFMTDNCKAEKNALWMIWPEAKQFLCTFLVGQQEWRYLHDAKNQIKPSDRRDLMNHFLAIMYAENEKHLKNAVVSFRKKYKLYSAYVERVTNFLETKEEWVRAYRKDVLYRDHNTNNFSEACIRILKDIILCRTRAYNACALVDFVANVWEEYFQKRIYHFALNRERGPTQIYAKLCKALSAETLTRIEKRGEHDYLVPSGRDSDMMYEVNSSVGWCACPAGIRGAFCKHQLAVYETYGEGFPNIPPINGYERHQLGRLALGDTCPDAEFFLGLQETEKEMQENAPQQDGAPTPAPQLEESSAMDLDVVPHENRSETCSDQLYRKIIEALNKVHSLAAQNSGNTYKKTQESLLKSLNNATSANQALELLMRFNAGTRGAVRKRGDIRVQPTSIARRKEGKFRGRKRLLVGRPPMNQPPGQKRKHQLSLSLSQNVRHVKKHGEGH